MIHEVLHIIFHGVITDKRFTFCSISEFNIETHLDPRSLVVVHAGGDPEVDGEGDLRAEAGVPGVEEAAPAAADARPVGVVAEAGAVRVVGEALQ